MPAKLGPVDPYSIIGEHPQGAVLSLCAPKDDYPLYRDLRLITPAGQGVGARRSHRLTWIMHDQRFRRGGDAWKLVKANPALMSWAEEVCKAELPLSYVAELLEISAGELDALVKAERAKYAKG